MSRPTTLVGDCLGVVNSIIKLKLTNSPMGVHGGLMKDAAGPGRLSNVVDTRWMPSHRVLKEDPTPEEKLLHDGSERVDKAAGEARDQMEEYVGHDLLREAAAN